MPRRIMARTKLGARSRRCSASTDQRKSPCAVLKASWTMAEKGQAEPEVLTASVTLSDGRARCVWSISMGWAGTVVPPILTPRERTIWVSWGLMRSVTPHSQLGQRKEADIEPSSSRLPFCSNCMGSSHSVQTNFMIPDSLLAPPEPSLKRYVPVAPSGVGLVLLGKRCAPAHRACHGHPLQPCVDRRGYVPAAALPRAYRPQQGDRRAGGHPRRWGTRTSSYFQPGR